MKTALVLSGGGSRGAYEIGAYQALLDMDIAIDMVVGSSIGAMNAYVIAQKKLETAKAFWMSLRTDEVFDRSLSGKNFGASFDGIKKLLDANFSEEAVRSSDIDFGICTVKLPEEFRRDGSLDFSLFKEALSKMRIEVLKLWTEDIAEGKMLDYVLASCSCYPIVVPYEIDGQKYVDGGFADYLPVSMVLERGADRIIAVTLDAVGLTQYYDLAKAKFERELIFVKPSGKLGRFDEFDPENSARIMHMGYIDTMRAFKRLGLTGSL